LGFDTVEPTQKKKSNQSLSTPKKEIERKRAREGLTGWLKTDKDKL